MTKRKPPEIIAAVALPPGLYLIIAIVLLDTGHTLAAIAALVPTVAWIVAKEWRKP